MTQNTEYLLESQEWFEKNDLGNEKGIKKTQRANKGGSDEENVSRFASVNLHITKACNYECKFCFAHFNDSESILREKAWKEIIDQLVESGCQKINFVGGEPFLHPDLISLLRYTSSLDLTTSIVTNGSLMTEKFLLENGNHISWIGFSIDSANEKTERKMGRKTKKSTQHKHIDHILSLLPLIRRMGINLKINSVITSLNANEEMNELIKMINPYRWKVFQVLPIKGENDDYIKELEVIKEEFDCFIERHKQSNPIKEGNDEMTGSYVMVDPMGRFFDNTTGKLVYSRKILDVGIIEAFDEIEFSLDKMRERNGLYDW